jgi:hypothetical protein
VLRRYIMKWLPKSRITMTIPTKSFHNTNMFLLWRDLGHPKKMHPTLVIHKEENTIPRLSGESQSGEKRANIENTIPLNCQLPHEKSNSKLYVSSAPREEE